MSRTRWRISPRRETAWHVPFVVLVAGIGCQSALDLDQYAFNEQTAPEPPAMEDGAAMTSTPASSGDLGNGGGSPAAGGTAASVDTLGSVPSQGGGSGGAAGGGAQGGSGEEMAPAATGGGGPGGAAPMAGDSAPVPSPGTCVDDGVWSIAYTDRSGTVQSQMSMILDVTNAGAPTPLSGLVFRYWFNADGHIDFTAELDYIAVDSAAVTDSARATFGAALGSHYGDIGFFGTDRELVSTATIQVRLRTSNYDTLDQSNDFSFMPGAEVVNHRNIAVYVDGLLVSGCEPEPP